MITQVVLFTLKKDDDFRSENSKASTTIRDGLTPEVSRCGALKLLYGQSIRNSSKAVMLVDWYLIEDHMKETQSPNYSTQIEKFMSFTDAAQGAVAIHVPFHPQEQSASCIDNIEASSVELSVMYFDSAVSDTEKNSITSSVESLRLETSGIKLKYGWANEKIPSPSDANKEMCVLVTLVEDLGDMSKEVAAAFEEKTQRMMDLVKPRHVEKLQFKPFEAPLARA